MLRAILTGATGAVGTALADELIRNDVEVLVLTHPGSARNKVIPKHPLVTTLDCGLDQLASCVNDTGKTWDVLYHFAWAGTTGSARNDMYMQNLNVRYALDAVDAAVRFGCRLFIGAGSQAEYGRHECKLRPDTPCFPENGYGMAKLCAGQMTRVHAHQLGMEHIWVRIVSIYGPHDSEGSLVMSVIRDLKNGKVPQCTRGEQLWDYLYSGDAAEAFRLLGEKGVDGKTYVLGSGHPRLLSDYIYEIRDVVAPGAKIELGSLPYPVGQVMHLEADIADLQRDTAWSPSESFAAGIRQTGGSLSS